MAVAVTVTGTFSGTLNFIGTNATLPFATALAMTPLAGGSTVITATVAGTWNNASIGGLTIVGVYASALASGTPTVTITSSTTSGSSTGGGALQFQNAGAGLGSAGTFNCSTNLTCTITGGVLTIVSSSSGTTTNQVLNGVPVNTNGTSTALNSVVCTPPTANGQYPFLYNITASATAQPTCPLLGLSADQAAGAAVLYSDNGSVMYNPASALSLPNTASLGNPNFYTVSQQNANAVVVTPASPFNIALDGGAAGTSQAPATLPYHTRCGWMIDQVASTQWDIDCWNVYGFFGGIAVPTSATGLATNSSGGLVQQTGANISSIVQGLTGCNTATYTYTPQANDCVAPSGGAAFSAITGGTNTTAAMVLGSGSSLALSGTGAVNLSAGGVGGLVLPAITSNTGAVTGELYSYTTGGNTCLLAPQTAIGFWCLAVVGGSGSTNTVCVNQVITALYSYASPTCTSLSDVLTVANAYTNATTTPSSVVGLTAALSANTAYAISCHIVFQGSATTTGLLLSSTGPASPTKVTASLRATTTTGAAAVTWAGASDGTTFAFSLGPTTLVTTGADLGADLNVGIINGTNAGTFQLQAAAAGTGTVTIQPGSTCTKE
jgi:hypothetical protein